MFCALTYIPCYGYSSICFSGWFPSGAVAYCLCCFSGFVISNSAKLLHLVSGLTLIDTTLVSASFYWPAFAPVWSPKASLAHTHKISLSPVSSPSNFFLYGMNGCIQTRLLRDLHWASLPKQRIYCHKGREEEQESGSEGQNVRQNKEKHKRGC